MKENTSTPIPLRVRSSIVCCHEDKLLTLLYRDPTTLKEFWGIPGGKIEDNEEPWAAAEREGYEETGFALLVDRSSETIKFYDFVWDGKITPCKTYFFKATLRDPKVPRVEVVDASYIIDWRWMPMKEVKSDFSTHPVIAATVLELIRK